MHLAYRLYNALASLHLLIGTLLLLTGVYGSFHYISTEEKAQSDTPTSWDRIIESNATAAWEVNVRGFTLSGPYFISCVSAALYSTLYLSFFIQSTATKEEDNQLWSKTPYYHAEADPENDELQRWANLMIVSEIVYWSFVMSYSYVAMASNTLVLNSAEFFYLRLVIHLFCIYTICSSAHHKAKRVDIPSSFAFVGFVAETFFVIASAHTQLNIVMGYFHRFLDLLLILGHRWDHDPSWEVIMNCRLFIIAVGGGLLHVDMLVSSNFWAHWG